jgi:hypothetical protein
MSTLTTEHIAEPPTVEAVDEALRWASAGGVRVWTYLDKLLDERLEARAH